jgi:hypothetical protein
VQQIIDDELECARQVRFHGLVAQIPPRALNQPIEHGVPALVVLEADHAAENAAVGFEGENGAAQDAVEEVVGFRMVVVHHDLARQRGVALAELHI